jgi:hypothetical protein
MNMKLLAAAVFSAGISVASSAYAGLILVPGSGWQYDQATSAGTNSQNSPVELIVPTGDSGIFSLTDAYIPGDVYSVAVGLTPHGPPLFALQSVFALYPTTFDNNLGPYASTFAPAWLDTSFSHLQIRFGSGTFYLNIMDIQNEGFPAGFGERLDFAIPFAIPEASTWAMLGVGFAGIGLVGMTRHRKGSRYAL